MQGIRNTHSTGMCKVLVKYKDIEYNDCTALGRAMQEEHQMTFFLKLQETPKFESVRPSDKEVKSTSTEPPSFQSAPQHQCLPAVCRPNAQRQALRSQVDGMAT